MTLAKAMKKIRPEIDIYLLADREVAKLAGSDEATAIRRIFYDIEELMEIHLSILDGINDRYETPYFSNLKKYSQKTDRHLPCPARGPGQIDLQVELDPRHGPFLRGQPLSGRVVGHHRRPGQPARTDREHQGRPGEGRPGLRALRGLSSVPTAPPRPTRSWSRRSPGRGISSWLTGTATSPTTTGSSWPAPSRCTWKPIRWWNIPCTGRCR